MTCINCGNSVESNFCSHCGQRTAVKRITFKEGWNDFWSRIYGFDGMFPRTFRDLTIAPGQVAKRYIEGNRILYYGPVGYFFLMITLYLLLLNFSGIDISEFIRENQQMFSPNNQSEGQKRFSQMAVEFVSSNIKWITFIIMPFNALAARYLLFRKSALNLMEHMVIPFYIAGHMYWLSLITIPVYMILNILWLNNVVLLFIMVYNGIAYSQLLGYSSRIKTFLKGILVPLLGQLLLMLVVTFMVIITLNAIKYFSPDTLEQIIGTK